MSVLHGASLSPFVRKVRIVLAEKKISYDQDPVVPINVSDEFKKISPLGKIPVYSPAEGVHIPDSSVIIAYLERVQPEPPVYPTDPLDVARALFLEEYADTALVEAAAPVFFQRVIGPRLMGQATDEEVVEKKLTVELPPRLDWLESQLGDKEFFVADRFTVADIAVVSPLVNLLYGGEHVDAVRWPKVAAYFDRLIERPSIAALLDEEKSFMQSAA